MTDQLKQAAQQALDWLYENDIVHPSKVSKDLKAALEQQQAEPMAYPEVALAEAYRCGYEAGAAAEREACAKVCEAGINNATDWDNSYWDQCCENRAAAIRARSQA